MNLFTTVVYSYEQNILQVANIHMNTKLAENYTTQLNIQTKPVLHNKLQLSWTSFGPGSRLSERYTDLNKRSKTPNVNQLSSSLRSFPFACAKKAPFSASAKLVTAKFLYKLLLWQNCVGRIT